MAKNAHEMFVDLGFELVELKEERVSFIKEENFQRITFFTKTKRYITQRGVSVREHKAITKQMVEFGWINEKEKRTWNGIFGF